MVRQRPIDRTRFASLDPEQVGQIAPTILRAGKFFGILCLLFATAFTACVPASVEQRIASLFLFGLIPAAGFYAGGHILSQLMVLGSELCERIAAYCFRYVVRLVNRLVSWIRLSVSNVSVAALSQNVYRVVRQRCWRAHAAFIKFLCLLIRSTARFLLRMQASYVCWASKVARGGRLRSQVVMGMLFATFGLGWCCGNAIWPLHDLVPDQSTREVTVEAVVERIISIESNGDPNKKNKRSSATGLAQFLDKTWLELIQTHRPDLARGRSEDRTLELRGDAKLAREITMRFTEQNAELLRKRSLPVTPGTLYLAHFAGGAGALAILSAPENSDAASAMASADATGRTKREKIVKANPFLERFTVAELKSWADRKMRIPGS